MYKLIPKLLKKVKGRTAVSLELSMKSSCGRPNKYYCEEKIKQKKKKQTLRIS
jgi:hypothetical protein